MIRRAAFLALAILTVLSLTTSAQAAEAPCTLVPLAKCFGVESVDASLSTVQAGDHPDLTFTFDVTKDPASKPNLFGLKNGYAATRNVKLELPPGLIGDPNALGVPQQCAAQELLSWQEPGGGCPIGSQVGITTIYGYTLQRTFTEPVYMMAPPGGDVVARVGFIAGLFPIFVDAKLRSESDYGITLEIANASAEVTLIKAETTTWGVPTAASHDTERCTPHEVFTGCLVSEVQKPGGRKLPFLTNPTTCGVPLSMTVAASSWVEPERFAAKKASFPEIVGCNSLPFGPDLTMEPTSRQAAAPTGSDVTIRLPASEGVNVLEPSQIRDVRVELPEGFAFNPSAGDGLATCSADQVNYGQRSASECPDASKVADTEFDIPVLERRLKGAIYLREPEPGNPFRLWIVADDLGLHVKLPSQLEVNKSTGQITAVTRDIPQAPVREAKLLFKSGFRAPLVNPPACKTYFTRYEMSPWSGGPSLTASTPTKINEGCAGLGGFSPKLKAGTIDSAGGRHSPFVFTLTREDGEQNPADLDISLPPGLAATFSGIARCEGSDAVTGTCPASSRIGKVLAAVGAGPAPLWVPQPGKRPTAVYLSGPYKGGPLSIVAVVPRQAGPFDFGDEVVRSAIYVDPITGQATAKADPLPQLIEGIPIKYRALNVDLDRPNFTLNPTNCKPTSVQATVTSSQGAVAHPSSPFAATNCAGLPFKPRIAFHLRGGTRRGAHPSLRAVLRGRPGDANIAGASVALPHSEFLDQSHIKTICTRVQFAANECPAGSIYGHAEAKTPLFEEPLSGPVYLRSSSHDLPDLVVALKGPNTLPVAINLAGRIDSVNGGIRSTFELVPDAPVSSFVLHMQGGKKGLLVNSTNICAKPQLVTAKFIGQNGRQSTQSPALNASCGKHRRRPVHR